MDNNANSAPEREKFTVSQILRCVLPSLVGGFAFLCPVMYEGNLVIPITIAIKTVNAFIGGGLVYSAFAIIVLSGVFILIGTYLKPGFIVNNRVLNNIFNTKWYWVILRVIGVVFCGMALFGVGPEFIISADTGSFVLYDLISGILTIGVIAGAMMPLLVEFGLMEFVGTFFGRFFKKLFRIPGRAAVDCVASWLGDTSVAVLLTNQQYESGYYNAREACTIATTFSAVSITFALVVIEQVGFLDMFFPFYGTVCLVGVACAIILPRIPPLSRKKDEYFVKSTYEGEVYTAPGYNLPQWAFHQAVVKANGNGYTLKKYCKDWAANSLTMLCVLSPIIMAVGTSALIVAYYTPILEWLGLPFMPLLQLLQIPEAKAASTTMVAGFADMFIPSVIASGTIGSPFTRFLVAVISITQLIFISENGSMILSTKIPVNLTDLFVIFLERTIVSVVIASFFIRFVLQIPLV